MVIICHEYIMNCVYTIKIIYYIYILTVTSINMIPVSFLERAQLTVTTFGNSNNRSLELENSLGESTTLEAKS